MTGSERLEWARLQPARAVIKFARSAEITSDERVAICLDLATKLERELDRQDRRKYLERIVSPDAESDQAATVAIEDWRACDHS